MEKDILHIAEFGHAAWKLILSIYKSEWDALTANKDKDKKESVNPSKLANVSRISHPVLQRPNKKVLEKSKFYKLKVSFFISSSSLSSSKEHSYAQAF